jgi:hypothetical protein
MFPCPLCSEVFNKRVDVDAHLKSKHAENTSPYKCDSCTSAFGTEKALKAHVKNFHTTSLKRKATCEYDFTEWAVMVYNPGKKSVKEKLSDSTIQRIVQFKNTMTFGDNKYDILGLLTENDEDMTLEMIDNWIDSDIRKYELQTVNNHVRYVNFVISYYAETRVDIQLNENIIHYVQELVHSTQLLTSRNTSTINLLKLEDPYALSTIRDLIVNGLLKEQVDYIDPYIIRYINSPNPDSCKYDFGTRFRNWIELAIRFTNIPCRIQCTRDMRLPVHSSYTYVSKLVRKNGQFHRLINQDKTRTSHQPLSLPLDSTLSVYLSMYIDHFRPCDTDSDYVFLTKKGAKWNRPSRDLKKYIECVLQIPIDEIDPTGRFIHASRSIMMASFAIRVAFDHNRMHEFARLMRHSSTTNEQYYSIWQQKHASDRAIDTFSTVFNLDMNTYTPPPIPEKARVALRLPGSIIRHYCHHQENDNSDHVVPHYATRSIGTQTNSDTSSDPVVSISSSDLNEVDIAGTIPSCLSCKSMSLCVYGPFGAKRRKKYYGRYYLACHNCHKDPSDTTRFHLPSCLWYPIGYTPLQKSQSAKPRNMETICAYIQNITRK